MRRLALLALVAAVLAAIALAPAQAEEAPVTAVRTPIPTAATDADVFIVGDSLTVAAAPYLEARLGARGWRPALDAANGRTFNQGLAVLQRHNNALPPTVVVALGTNDLMAPTWAFEWWVGVARHAVGARRLVFVNVYVDGAKNPSLARPVNRVNEAIARSAQFHGAEVADWATFAKDNRIETEWDGVHYGAAASEKRADFYGQSLSPVRTAER